MTVTSDVLRQLGKIAVSWHDEEAGAWLEYEATSTYLIFRVLARQPSYSINGLHSVEQVPEAFEALYGVRITYDDCRRAYQSYRRAARSGKREGRAALASGPVGGP